MQNSGKFQPGNNMNPEGMGGFIEHPEHINYGGRPKNQNSFTYWLNFFKRLTVAEFDTWKERNAQYDISIAADIAYTRVSKAKDSLKEFREVADRTEGKAFQTVSHENGFFSTDRLEIVCVE